MDQVKAKLIRIEDTDKGSVGSLSLFGQLFCSTIEPDSKDPLKGRIPEGIYYCKRRIVLPGVQVKFPYTFEIKVPGHTDVLFHSGNREKDTDMCIILGMNYPWTLFYGPDRWLYDSRKVFDSFMQRLSGVDWFYIEIKNLY